MNLSHPRWTWHARRTSRARRKEPSSWLMNKQPGAGAAITPGFRRLRSRYYLSVILRPSLAPAQAGWVTMIAALAVVDTIRDEAERRREGEREPGSKGVNDSSPILPLTPSPRLSIKWFNDVLVNQRKVCGILVEVSIEGDKLQSMIVGIGLNVNTRFDAAPPDVQARATSLTREFGFELDRQDVLRRLLAHLGARL